jgi:hypothetical protein
MKLFNDIFSTDFRKFRNFANAPKNNIKTFAIKAYIHSFISNLSYDRSTASSKTIPPLNAI